MRKATNSQSGQITNIRAIAGLRKNELDRLACKLAYVPKVIVTESEQYYSVIYAIQGNTIYIGTANNGHISMPLEDFRAIAAEANEVFKFWEGA